MPLKEPASKNKGTAGRRPPQKNTLKPSPDQPELILQQTGLKPGELTPQAVLQLQRTVGNQKVAKLLSGAAPKVQPELSAGPAQEPEGGFETGGDFETRLDQSQGGGQPLPGDVQAEFGSKFGADFSGVRVHTGPEAVELNQQINAKAFTHGSDIHFGAGQYDPGSGEGQRLLAHELTHTLQQGVVPSAPAIQRVREDEFRADPEDFLNNNVLSLTMKDGMLARSNNNRALAKPYDDFVKKMGAFRKHWFKLVPDAARTKPDQPAYILTPAIEKYMAEYPEDEVFAALDGKPDIPALEEEDQYILSAFIEYKSGGTANPDTDVGHTTVTADREAETEDDFNPDFVFTAAMNGCAFAVTPGVEEGEFEAWHYQSPGSNLANAASFRRNRNPTDWYGAEEYEQGEHAGLFEVTNLMHRGADNRWNILSQQNETSAQNPNDVSIQNVGKRALNLGADNAANIKKRVYKSIMESKLAEMRRAFEQLQGRSGHYKRAENTAVANLSRTVMALLDQEAVVLNAAGTLLQLRAAGNTLKQNRTTNQLNVETMTDSLRQQFLVQYTVEDKRKWFRSADKVSAYNLGERSLAAVKDAFNNHVWIDALIAETAA